MKFGEHIDAGEFIDLHGLSYLYIFISNTGQQFKIISMLFILPTHLYYAMQWTLWPLGAASMSLKLEPC